MALFGFHSKIETRFYFILILGSLSGCTTSCSNYDRTEYIEGVYQPTGMVKLEARPVASPDRIYEITITHPFEVTELGLFKRAWYQDPLKSNHNAFTVVKAEIFRGKFYFISVNDLIRTGRLQYYERPSTFKEWLGDHVFLSFVLGLSALILFFYFLNRYASRQTKIIVLFGGIVLVVFLIISYWYIAGKYLLGIGLIALFGYIGSFFSFDSKREEDTIHSRKKDFRRGENRKERTRRACNDCLGPAIDISLESRGNGLCRACGGTGHDYTAEAWQSFGSFGAIDNKIACKICHGTKQCQSCGGTGFVYRYEDY